MKTIRKRRKKGKTNYRRRIGLLKSEMPRVVIRKSNKYISIQYVKSNGAKDKVVVGASSKELIKYGWPENLAGSLKSVPAAYITGYLTGKKIIKKEKTTALSISFS